MMLLRGFFTLVLCIALTSCERPPNHPQHWRHLAMGTWVDVTVYGPQRIDKIVKRLAKLLDESHRRWHAWHPGELLRINQALAKGQCVKVSTTTQTLIHTALKLWKASDGLFDAGIGGLLRLWGFQRDNMLDDWQPPSEIVIANWRNSRPSIHQLYFVNENTVCSRDRRVALDFGGFGKGFVLGLVSQTLTHMKVPTHMVNGGGDIVVGGQPPHRPWRIAIQHPFSKEKIIATLKVSGNKSVFTSGTYERAWTYNDQRYHHILDPRTGKPAQGTVSVTVIGEDPVWMDAAATAMLIAGPKCAAKLARQMHVQAWLLIDTQGTAYLNDLMKNSIEWVDPPDTIKLVGDAECRR